MASGSGGESLVAIRAGGSKPPVFCLHAQAGHLRLYHNLAQHVDQDRPLFGLRGVLSDESPSQPYCRFEDMARRYVREVREFQPKGPYLLLGECDGAELAYEMAQQLRGLGENVSMLALVESFGPGGPRRRWFAPKMAYRLIDTMRMVGFHLRTLSRLDGRAGWDYVTVRLARLLDRIATAIFGSRGMQSTEPFRRRGFREALDAYLPAPYPGRVVLFRATKLPWGIESTRHLGWGSLVADLKVVELPCYFGTGLLEPTVGLLAQELDRALDGSAARPST
ncbi:MAG: thioesterase domain-containing protein [Solirubrobacteraceae bacterium]